MKIKILGLYYNIKFVEAENIDGFYGEIVHKKNLIRLNKDQTTDRTKESLIHEINHAIDAELKLKLNEDTIDRLSNVWHAVIVDNSHIFRYTLNQIEHEMIEKIMKEE